MAALTSTLRVDEVTMPSGGLWTREAAEASMRLKTEEAAVLLSLRLDVADESSVSLQMEERVLSVTLRTEEEVLLSEVLKEEVEELLLVALKMEEAVSLSVT